MKMFDIIEVVWFDTITVSEVMTIERIKSSYKPTLTKSIGYFIFENNEYTIIAFVKYSDQLFKYFQVIPNKLIEEVKIVGEKK